LNGALEEVLNYIYMDNLNNIYRSFELEEAMPLKGIEEEGKGQ